MSDDTTSTEDQTTEDDDAQKQLAEAAANSQGDDDNTTEDDKSTEPDESAEQVKKWKALARKHETESKAAAKRLKEIDDKDKSESQKLADQLAESKVELEKLQVATVRRDAAEAANLPAKFVKFITASEPDEALEQAKELAKELKTSDDSQNTNGKAADFRQGNRGAGTKQKQQTPDDYIRWMAGR